VTARRLALLLVVLGLIFAVAAGEYSTWDWLTLRREERVERARIAALQGEVDSLAREAIAVETDPEVQERLARELYGMLRQGEFGYTIERGDSLDRVGGRR
jgi:cell division protein FtsB